MNACPNESCWIRLIADEVEPAERNRLRAHLEGCAQCRTLHEELRTTREILLHVGWDPPTRDLAAAVRAAAVRERVRPRWLRATQAAAVILLAAGLGVGAGRLVKPGQASRRPVPAMSTDELVQVIGLDTLGDQTVLSEIFSEASPDAGLPEEVPS